MNVFLSWLVSEIEWNYYKLFKTISCLDFHETLSTERNDDVNKSAAVAATASAFVTQRIYS